MNRSWYPLNKGQASGYKIAYTNARIIDPFSEMDVTGTVVTVGTKISEICSSLSYHEKADEIIDCNGNILIPGMIDIHVHFREPGFEHKEDINSGSMAAAAGGVTTVVCQPNTDPRISTVCIAKYIKYRAEDVSHVRIEFYSSVTSENGEVVNMSAMSNEGAVGFTDDGLPIADSSIMMSALESADMFGFLIAQHAEDLSLSHGGCMNKGPTCCELGLNGIPNVAESVMVARDIELIKEFKNARYHVLHISTAESLEIVKLAKKAGLNVTCEVAPHHFTLTDKEVKTYGSMAKMNPPLRSEKDVAAMIEGLKNNDIDCIATDHAPHEAYSKSDFIANAPFGIIGLETMLPISLELHFKHKINLYSVLRKLTCTPASIISVNRGRIFAGYDADLALVNLNQNWTITKDDFVGKSKNSPFVGRNVSGRVIRTIALGKTVYTLNDSSL